MKTNQIETTRLLISQLQEKHDLTQKEIASKLRLSEPELSKAKNPKPQFINEISEERRATIISSLRHLLSQKSVGNHFESSTIHENNRYINNGESKKGITLSMPLSHSELKSNLMYGSIITALVAHIITVVLKDISGYSTLNTEAFTSMVVFSFLFHLLFGVIFGYLTFAAIVKIKKGNSQKYYAPFLLLLFVSTLFILGLNSRDSYLLCTFVNKDCNGLLGEPNFELIASTLSFSLGGFALVKFLVDNNEYNIKHAFRYSIKLATICAVLFLTVYLLFLITVKTGLIIEKDFIINTAIFKFSFSHPERVTQTFLKVFLFLFLILTILKYRLFSSAK